jgi:hypothetical protein
MPSKSRSDRIAADWPLPAEPYIPGVSPRPSGDDDIHRIARSAPDPTDPSHWQSNPAWLAGLRLYRAGYFWEAHEAWEPVWMNARPNSPERALVQAVIQLANAGLKARMGRPKASRRLMLLAEGLVRDLPGSTLMGVDLPRLRRDLDRHATSSGNDWARLPRL